ncbi:hypothetical protein AVEN_193637-1 [Araneus ventricosus]|uniref:Uncharacterized protein n=1 Tax=Araneus ventricosus TaxID=182803 RepID=A0A4Y2HEX5_ARAVE|nr:hypothetical protein AVEN_193637-1 [Araneus ventricosus]
MLNNLQVLFGYRFGDESEMVSNVGEFTILSRRTTVLRQPSRLTTYARSVAVHIEIWNFPFTEANNPLQLVPKRPVGNTDNLYFVLYGGSLIHRVVWPKQDTFGDVNTTYMSYIKRHYGAEVTVVFDGYTESSVNTKVFERQRRRMKRASREIIFNESTVLLDPQRQFLSNLANKECFNSQTR